MAKSLDIEQVEALIEKNRALVARERERVNELKTQNADTLQEACTSLTVPASAFGMSYARAYFGERASIAGIPIDAGLGLILKAVAACFGLSVSKGGQRVGKFLQDIANGAFAAWTAALGAEYGAKKRLEKPVPLPAPQPNMGAIGLVQEMPKRAPGPMTFDDLAAITAARQEQPAVATARPAVGVAGTAQETPKPASSSTIIENFAAMTAAMLMTPRAPQQSAPTPALSATTVPPTPPSLTPPLPPLGTQPTPPANPQKPYRFAQSRAARLPDLSAAFGCGTYSMQDVDKNTQWLSKEYSSESLASILKWATAPT